VETITIVAWLDAPIETCFDAARDLDLHMKSVQHTDERAVAGRTSGLISAGEEVTWRARHFGITQHFTSRITAFDRPRYFQDTMQRGAFKSFVHDHFFESDQGKTKMTEALRFSAPLGLLGRIAEKLVLRRHLKRLLELRVAAIRDAVEAVGVCPASESTVR
jgi:ligand-binding SRPBCC domain-containing protein